MIENLKKRKVQKRSSGRPPRHPELMDKLYSSPAGTKFRAPMGTVDEAVRTQYAIWGWGHRHGVKVSVFRDGTALEVEVVGRRK